MHWSKKEQNKKQKHEFFVLYFSQVFLEQQLETERSRLEAEKQRVSVAEEQICILVSVLSLMCLQDMMN
jgi:hypothetical protein